MPADLTAALSARGVTNPFPIQSATIADAIAGRDVCGRAPTGSGKTLAFGVPLVSRLKQGASKKPTALVLAPTRELAAQIRDELAPLLAVGRRRIAAVYGGVSIGPQIKALNRGVDVLVACPGRLRDLIERGACRLGDVGFVVVDEADRMADMGFLPEVCRLLDATRRDRQTLLFSATLDGDVDTLIRRYQREPVRHDVTPPEPDDSTTHIFLDTKREERVSVVRDLIAAHGSAVVFCRTKHGADRLTRQLVQSGVKAVPIHGNRSQSQREQALASFVSGRARALVATDVAARGIHVDNVGCVVHFDMPADAKAYVHRSGRTGRAGAAGTVVTLVTPSDRAAVREIQSRVGGGAAVRPDAGRPRTRPARPRRAARSSRSRAARPT